MKKLKNLQDKESRITSEDIEKCTDTEELLKMKTTIMVNLVDTKEKIDKAAAEAASDGKYSDPDWWARINSYKRVLGYLHQRIQFKERELRAEKIEKIQKNVPQRFMDCAKEILPAETFYKILSAAHEQKEETINNFHY